MASILPQFEYDIFISYRHNDNRGGWVTEFVKALQEELASTIKDPVSVYFDTNPHDGLLETHNVDKSLEGKLKCFIFIPILSQTYCDPKSFAWQHEFVAFNKLAKEDQVGRDIKLSNGNVASRILPIKIHDLDAEDKATLENEIGGVLRAIEFIYKEPGVNRPLKSFDNKSDNQNKTDYRNQVNKTANAVKDIINALKNPSTQPTRTTTNPDSYRDQPIARTSSTKKYIFAFLTALVVITASYFGYQKINSVKDDSITIDKSIAVLPFVDMSAGKDQEYLGDGIAEDIITVLSRIKELKVIGRTSSFQFKGEKIDLRDLGEKLDVATVLEGSIMKSGNRVRITAQLINVSDGTHIWSERYDKNMDDIFAIQDQISKAISDKMKISLLGNKQHNRGRPTSSTEAFESYLQGQQILEPSKGPQAKPYFEKAIQLDSNYADAYAGLAWSYFFSWKLSRSEIVEKMMPLALKVLELDPESEKSHELLYVIHGTCNWNWKLANEEYKKYLAINPKPLTVHAQIRAESIGDFKDGIEEFNIRLESDPINKTDLRLIGRLYALDNQFTKAKEMINKAIEIDPYLAVAYRTLAYVNILEGNYSTALENLKKVEELDHDINVNELRIWALTKAHRMKEAGEVYALMDFSKPGNWSHSSKAKIEFWLGHTDEGFRWLELAFAEKEFPVQTIRFNPEFEIIRDHPRFKEFIKKVPFPPNNF